MSLRPTRSEAVQLGLAVLTLLLAIAGFLGAFSGPAALTAGIPAVLIGSALGWVLARRRVDLLVGAAAVTGVLVALAGPLALRATTLFGFVPTPSTLQELVTGLVAGPVRLLTTVPPAGPSGALLVVPFAVGLLGAVLTIVADVRVARFPIGPLLALLVLVVALLFGTREPVSLVLHGAVFAAALAAWLAVRSDRDVSGALASLPSRIIGSAVVLALVAGAATVTGPLLPGAEANERFVLRDLVEPPFDPLSRPSPLVGYRRYVGPDNEEAPVLEVTGLPPGVPIRLAVLDDYDGLVWQATGSGGPLAGTFSRVGDELPDSTEGEPVTVGFEVLDPHDVWLPTVGDPTAITFEDPDLATAVRVNLATRSAAVPDGVRAGLAYTVRTDVTAIPPEADLRGLPIDPRFAVREPDVPPALREVAAQLRGGAESPYGRVAAMAAALRDEGAFSDGGPEAVVPTPPGHSLARLLAFLGAPQFVGNGEQYAAALGLLARVDGIPARVVMGFRPDQRGGTVTVTGADVDAWVEVPLAGVGWVPVEPTPPEDQAPDPSIQPQARELNPEPQPPPPPQLPPDNELPRDLDAADAEAEEEDEDDEEEDDEEASAFPWGIVVAAAGGLLALVLLPAAVIALLKFLRRRRRRGRGSQSERAHGGWREVVDRAADHGRPVPPLATRREAAHAVGASGAVTVADHTDALVFAGGEPSDADLTRLWEQVAEVLQDLDGQHSTIDRLRATVSLTSLRRSR